MRSLKVFQNRIRAFCRDESGVASVQFVMVFPIFMLFFGMTFENGIVSLRHVMLERGVDIAVRDVRIGRMPNPTRELLRSRICDVALLIPDCENALELEMITRDPRSWQAIPANVACVDRGDPSKPKAQFTQGGNNQLVFLRACARFDPVMPTTGLGKVIVEENNSSAAGGSYAHVATSAFVVEPFRRDDD
ncbi:TadE/TadG family type IV pilus assembly protein [Yoonia sp. SS1-5]|uniref:TadE/TadG family type IV pilus assembly protein n=1 Tax=Yoonia rhodophyticola TaxID=3137370 RepID=A0AAN0MGK7_9RHOB